MSRSERIHLAQELHDGIAQDLVGVGYSLDLLLAAPDTPNSTRSELRTLRFTINDLLEKVRNEIHQLHSSGELGLGTQITRSAEELCGDFMLDINVEIIPLDQDGEMVYGIHQVARELFRNIAAHSAARQVRISLSTSQGMIHLRIEDDGVGGIAKTTSRFGIVGAQSRALSLGGTLTWDSSAQGTIAELRVPLSNALRT
jgi:signal transduction histidine kinase